jgi:hypothetical protein
MIPLGNYIRKISKNFLTCELLLKKEGFIVPLSLLKISLPINFFWIVCSFSPFLPFFFFPFFLGRAGISEKKFYAEMLMYLCLPPTLSGSESESSLPFGRLGFEMDRDPVLAAAVVARALSMVDRDGDVARG